MEHSRSRSFRDLPACHRWLHRGASGNTATSAYTLSHLRTETHSGTGASKLDGCAPHPRGLVLCGRNGEICRSEWANPVFHDMRPRTRGRLSGAIRGQRNSGADANHDGNGNAPARCPTRRHTIPRSCRHSFRPRFSARRDRPEPGPVRGRGGRPAHSLSAELGRSLASHRGLPVIRRFRPITRRSPEK